MACTTRFIREHVDVCDGHPSREDELFAAEVVAFVSSVELSKRQKNNAAKKHKDTDIAVAKVRRVKRFLELVSGGYDARLKIHLRGDVVCGGFPSPS